MFRNPGKVYQVQLITFYFHFSTLLYAQNCSAKVYNCVFSRYWALLLMPPFKTSTKKAVRDNTNKDDAEANNVFSINVIPSFLLKIMKVEPK